MRRELLIGAIALIVVLAVASQFALPRIAEDRIVDRLTAGGGTASASVSAFPALRLLFGDGDRLAVTGDGLTLPLSGEGGGFSRLDGFDSVDVRLRDVTAGPVTVRRFELRRDGIGPYRLRSVGHTSLAALASYGGGTLGGPLSGLALRLGIGQVLGAAARHPVPIDLDTQLADEGGRIVVVAGSGSIAGIPTGPLAELVTSAVAVRL